MTLAVLTPPGMAIASLLVHNAMEYNHLASFRPDFCTDYHPSA